MKSCFRKAFTIFTLIFLGNQLLQAADYTTISAGSDLSDISSWEEIGNPGVNPIDFTNSGDNFYIFHDGEILSNWDVAGTVIIGDAIFQSPIAFTIPSTSTFVVRTALIMEPGGQIIIQNSSNLVFNQTSPTTPSYTLNSGSIVTYDFSGSFTLPNQPYMNLQIINNSNTVTLASGTYNIEENFTHNAPMTLSSGTTLTLNGDFTGTGSLTGSLSSTGPILIVQGSGSVEVPAVNLRSLTVNNANGITMLGDISIFETLTMTQGNINLNSNSLTLGASITDRGTLSYSSGFITGSGDMTRYIGTSLIPLGNVLGRFPFGTGSTDRSFYLGGTATTAGSVTVSHDASSASSFTNMTSYTDNTVSVTRRHNMSWTVSTSGVAGSSFAIRMQGNGMATGAVTSTAGLRVSLASGVAPGNSLNGSGSTTSPQANRTALSASDLNNTFYIAGDATVNPLPVSLISFTVTDNSTYRTLNWSTASEQNNNRFEVERSLDGQHFSSIGVVPGAGNSVNTLAYSWNDNTILPEVSRVYYRLKQVDDNGDFSYSSIVTLQYHTQGVALLNTYPNPVQESLYLEVHTAQPGMATVMITDIQGKTILSNSIDLKQGYQQLKLSTGELGSGIYFMKIQAGEELITRKLMK